jgi:hypothetical protein
MESEERARSVPVLSQVFVREMPGQERAFICALTRKWVSSPEPAE